ncbi:IPTL-CTERM sorting domain-containing protein, partial [Lampropedia aestuarii]
DANQGGSELPAGLNLEPETGLITGLPTAAGVYPVTLTVTDSASNQRTLDWSINVALADVKVPEDARILPEARVGVAYTAQIVATGGTGRYRFMVSPGQLPDGLVLNPDTGAITGLPTTAGSSALLIMITDESSIGPGSKAGGTTIYTVTQAFDLVVLPA